MAKEGSGERASARERLLDAASELFYRGCAFARASAETPEGSSVDEVAERHRAWLRSLFVDLADLTKGQSLHVSDIQLPAGVKIVTHGKPNPVIVSANVQAAEVEEVAPAPVVAAAAPAPTKAKKTEKQNKK